MKIITKFINFIWIQCLLYHYIQQYHVTGDRCSWGSWLPWNCSCCGNSNDIKVFRYRAKCCGHTYECAVRRISSLDILNENEFEGNGSCPNDCGNLFSKHNFNTCDSSKMSLDDLSAQSNIKSCENTCLGLLTTTRTATTRTATTRTTTTPFAAKPQTTKLTREPTLHNASLQTTKIFRGGGNGTISTKNGQSKTSSLQFGSSIKDTTLFPGVLRTITSAKTSVTYPSSSKLQTGNTVSSEKSTPSNGGRTTGLSTSAKFLLGVLVLRSLMQTTDANFDILVH